MTDPELLRIAAELCQVSAIGGQGGGFSPQCEAALLDRSALDGLMAIGRIAAYR